MQFFKRNQQQVCLFKKKTKKVDMQTHLFTLKESHASDLVIYLFPKLLFQPSPGVADVMHLLRAFEH